MSESTKRRKAAAIAGGALGVCGLLTLGGGTVAAWNDAETAELQSSTGELNLQISTDGGDSWQDGTSNGENSYAVMEVADYDRETGIAESEFQLRLSPETTHDAVLSADNIESTFNVNDNIAGEYGFHIYETQGDLLLDGDVDPAEDADLVANGEVQLEAGDAIGRAFDVAIVPHTFVDNELIEESDTIIWELHAELGQADDGQDIEEPAVETPELEEHTFFVEDK